MWKPPAGAMGVYLFATVLFLGGGRIPGDDSASNLLRNPGFEAAGQGFPKDWGFFEANAQTMFCLDGEHAVEGKYSLRADGKPDEAWVPLFSNESVQVSPNEELTLGAYVKPEISAGTILFALREIGGDGQSLRFDSVPIPQKADWVFCKQKMKMSDKAVAIQVFIVMQKCVGRAWFDDLRLVRGDLQDPGPKPDIGKPANFAQRQIAAGQNLLGNGGLEPGKAGGGTPEGWRFDAGFAGHRGALDAGTCFAGSASFRMDHAEGGLPGSTLVTAAAVPILPNQDYVLSGWIRTAADGRSRWTTVPSARGRRVEGVALQIVFKDESRADIAELWSPAVQTNGAWQRIVVSGRAPGNATCAEVRLFHGDFKGATWFDAVRLEMAEDTADGGGTWCLPADTHGEGALPPVFSVVQEAGTIAGALLAGDAGKDRSILLEAGEQAKGELLFPSIDNSFPGTFAVSGEYRWTGTGKNAAVKLVFRSLDADGAAVAHREIPLAGQEKQWILLNETVAPDPAAGSLVVAVALEGACRGLELRNWRVQRLTRSSLADYAGITATGATPADSAPVTTPQTKPTSGFPDVRLGMTGGAPAVLIGGEPAYFNQYWYQTIPPDEIARNCQRAGLIQVLSISKIDWSKDPPTLNCQEEVDRQVSQVLKNDPEARIILMPDTSTEQGTVSWAFHHPAECYVSDVGGKAVKDYGGSTKTFPSFASAAWRQDVDDLLTGLVNHVKQAEYAPHVIGYLLSGYEWFHWEWSSPEARIDTSTHMRDEFRNWLKARYGNPAALRAAWGGNAADFTSVEIPSPEARRRTCDEVFRDPAVDQPVIDFSRFYSEVVADVLIRQARTIKAAGMNTLVFPFYGYLPHFFDSQARKSTGHFALRKLLDSGVVDTTGAPSDGYLFERAIGGAGAFMTVPGAYTVRGTLVVDQPDYRTHWAAQDIERTNTLRDDTQLFRRNFAMNLTNLAAIQYLDFSKFYTLGDRRLVKELSRYAEIEALARQSDRTPDGEGFAVIYSEDCADYVGTDQNLLGGGVTYHQRPLFFRAGMPHRWYLLSDLASPRLPDYRFYVFPNAYKLTPDERELIQRKCVKKGNVLLFVYAPGYTDAKTCSAVNISAFLGMTVAKCDGARRAEVAVAAASATMPWLEDSPGMTFGTGVDWPLMFRVEPTPDVQVLGRYTTDGVPALALRDVAGCKIVYSAVPLLPPDLLRDLGRLAGCNLYLGTSDALYADRNFVSIHTSAPGPKCIRLPRPAAEVYDLIKRTSLGRNTDRFTVEMEAHETAIFYVGTAPFAAGRPGEALTPGPAKRRWWPW